MSDQAEAARHQAECKRVYPTYSAADPCTCGADARPKRPLEDWPASDLILVANLAAFATGPVRDRIEATLVVAVLHELGERQLDPTAYIGQLLARAREAVTPPWLRPQPEGS